MADQRKFSLGRWSVRNRIWVQAGFLLVWLDPLMIRFHQVCGPVFHCHACPLAFVACPIGALAHFSALHLFPFIALGVLVLTGAMIGAAVCGWVCPFGLLQDLTGRIPTPKFKIPGWAGYGRYVVLVGLVLLVPWFLGKDSPLFFCSLCPAGALEGAAPNIVGSAAAGQPWVWPSAAKLTVLAVVLVAMVFTLRPWCTVLCPLGAIFSLFNHASFFVLKFKRHDCRECGACDKMCRYDVLPAVDVNNVECIRCMECTRCDAISLGTAFHPSDEHHPDAREDEPASTTAGG